MSDTEEVLEQEIPSYPSTIKHIPLDLLIEYAEKGLSYSAIAKLAGCTKRNVIQRFQTAGYDKPGLDAYKRNRADLLAVMQRKLLLSITDSDINKMAPRDRVLSSGILYDKERLERGQVSQIIGYDSLPDTGLDQAIRGLQERAARIGIRVTEIVGEIPQVDRDGNSPDTASSHTVIDVPGDNYSG